MVKVSIGSLKIGTAEIAQNVVFNAPFSKSTAIIGRSGAGKTSILKAIGGILPVAQGSISIEGFSPTLWRKKNTLAYLFQNPVVFEQLKVADALHLSAKLRGIALDNYSVETSLLQVGLEGTEDLYPFQMSMGMRARLTLAQSFMDVPKLLLMDEPFASLDHLRREELNCVVHDMVNKSSTTCLWVTHDIVEALRFSHQIVIMSSSSKTIAEVIDVTSLPEISDPYVLPSEVIKTKDTILELLKYG